MVSSAPKWIKLLVLLLVVLLCFIHNRCPTHSLVPLPARSFCSLDNISACQTCDNCSRTFLYISWNRAGFCSELNQVLLAFAYSVSTRRRFLIDSRQWNYGSFSDYFHFPSASFYPHPNRTFLTENDHKNELIDHLKTTRTGTQLHQFWIATRPVQSMQVKRRVAHYLWKSVSKETSKFIDTHRRTNLSDYIGLHIRSGDKVVKEAAAIPLEKYIHSIERLSRKDPQRRLMFVASDDRTVVERLRTLQPTWRFFTVHENRYRRKNATGHFQRYFNRLSKKEKLYETRLLMCELQMLADAKYVICGMSSNVCRLVQILRHQHPSTIISLDRSWRGT